VVEWAVLRLVGRAFRFAREDVDQYLRKVDEARRRKPWFWARLPVKKREGLGELHSGLPACQGELRPAARSKSASAGRESG
jgi:hypothetical protein